MIVSFYAFISNLLLIDENTKKNKRIAMVTIHLNAYQLLPTIVIRFNVNKPLNSSS